jgi:hypothetical protein
MQRLDRNFYDFIISNSRQNEPTGQLSACKIHYFDWPYNVSRSYFKESLDSFNDYINAPGGLVFMDRVKTKFKEDQAPPIIFYSASTGGIVTSLCSKTITNRADILLQSVVTSLKEQRWQELADSTSRKWSGEAR